MGRSAVQRNAARAGPQVPQRHVDRAGRGGRCPVITSHGVEGRDGACGGPHQARREVRQPRMKRCRIVIV